MGSIGESTLQALGLLFSGDRDLWQIIGISFKVSLTAMAIATPVAIATAFLLAFGRFPGRRLLIAVFNTLLSFPAVVVGLTFYLLLSRQGPLGEWQLLFTQPAMVIGQFALALPILVAMGHASLQAVNRSAWETARTLGAGVARAVFTLMREARFGLLGAMLAGFGRIIAELGASMMLGGNILHYTRNIPTAISLKTSTSSVITTLASPTALLPKTVAACAPTPAAPMV